jgi:hypothetical protein
MQKIEIEWIEKAGQKAIKAAFEDSGEDEYDWNDDVRIDYEVVLCTQK